MTATDGSYHDLRERLASLEATVRRADDQLQAAIKRIEKLENALYAIEGTQHVTCARCCVEMRRREDYSYQCPKCGAVWDGFVEGCEQ